MIMDVNPNYRNGQISGPASKENGPPSMGIEVQYHISANASGPSSIDDLIRAPFKRVPHCLVKPG